jgi:hypothetical protein
MRAVNGLVETLETLKLPRIDQKELSHGCTLLLKRDNSAAAGSEIPPPREVGATSWLRVLRQIIVEFDARYPFEKALH